MALDIQPDGAAPEVPEAAAQDTYANIPPTFGQRFGAMATESSPTQALTRAAQRGQFTGSSLFDQVMSGYLTNQEPGVEAGIPPTPTPDLIQSPMLTPDEYNQKFAPVGPDGNRVSLGTDPMPSGLAELIGRQKADEISREGVLARGRAVSSAVPTFAMGMAASMMDPLNLATAFIPGIGEEAIAARLGGGVLARTAGRAVAGFTGGLAAQALLTGLQYGLGTEEASDYGLRDALYDMTFGAATNALIHAGIFGGLREAGVLAPDRIMRAQAAPIVLADAPTKHAAMSTAVSQAVDGRPVDVLPLLAKPTEAQMEMARVVRPPEQRDVPLESPSESEPPYAERPEDIVDFLMARGGVRDESGELRAMDLNRVQKGRFGILSRPRGLSLDYAREAAVEAGFLHPDSDISDLLDAIHRTQAGLPVFRPGEDVEWKEYESVRKAGPGFDPYNPSFLSDVSESQGTLYRNGFAPGMSALDYGRATHEIYGPKVASPTEPLAPARAEGAPSSAGGEGPAVRPAVEADPEMAEAEQRVTADLLPEERNELDRTQASLDQAGLHEQAVNEAANCLGAAV